MMRLICERALCMQQADGYDEIRADCPERDIKRRKFMVNQVFCLSDVLLFFRVNYLWFK